LAVVVLVEQVKGRQEVLAERQVQILYFQLLPLPVEEVAEGRVLLLLRVSLDQTAGQEVAEVRELLGVRVVLETHQ
jgi:hypothetical protein